jgi:hypothetical protein
MWGGEEERGRSCERTNRNKDNVLHIGARYVAQKHIYGQGIHVKLPDTVTVQRKLEFHKLKANFVKF